MYSFPEIILFGVLPLPWWGYVLYLLIMTHITIITVTIYYHRSQAHRALDLHPAVSHFFRFWGWFTTSMNVKEWVSVHRKHHSKDDGPEDPHSPQVYGLWRILFFGVERYYQAAKEPNLLMRYGHGTPKDRLERKLYSNRRGLMPFLGVGILLLVNCILFGMIGILIWVLQVLWIPFWAAGVINGLGHWPIFKRLLCYRNAEIKDRSANIFPWGIWIGGEELHNNHHTDPISAKLSVKWYEFDLGWVYIRLLEILKLATVRQRVVRTDRI